MRTLRFLALTVAAGLAAASSGRAQEIRLPEITVAGQEVTISASGTGEGTLYLVGPGQVIKRPVQAGHDVQIKAGELRSAGRWIAILHSRSNSRSHAFWVQPAPPENLSFLARPSRVPVARPGVISGIAVVFDRFQNLVLEPTPVKFSLSMFGAGAGAAETVASRNGVAWINSSSARKAGQAQFVATAGDASVRRVVQQVASDPCNLRMHVVERNENGVILETDPVRDCTSNPVPDGTIVTFTQTDSRGRSTVDARVKKGIARAVLPSSDNASITVASGVVLGNELHVGGKQ